MTSSSSTGDEIGPPADGTGPRTDEIGPPADEGGLQAATVEP
ncbi:hypothetical protein [Halopenitus persicus]|nr:hypothetical protein [Halopenitus persicus]